MFKEREVGAREEGFETWQEGCDGWGLAGVEQGFDVQGEQGRGAGVGQGGAEVQHARPQANMRGLTGLVQVPKGREFGLGGDKRFRDFKWRGLGLGQCVQQREGGERRSGRGQWEGFAAGQAQCGLQAVVG